jgi:hypothetical protein
MVLITLPNWPSFFPPPSLTLNNTLLFVDLIVVPDIDLILWRNLTALIGVGTLLVSLIWETR